MFCCGNLSGKLLLIFSKRKARAYHTEPKRARFAEDCTVRYAGVGRREREIRLLYSAKNNFCDVPQVQHSSVFLARPQLLRIFPYALILFEKFFVVRVGFRSNECFCYCYSIMNGTISNAFQYNTLF